MPKCNLLEKNSRILLANRHIPLHRASYTYRNACILNNGTLIMETFGEFFCNCVSAFSYILPDTPYELTLGYLSYKLADVIPFVGSTLILEMAQNITLVLGLIIPYKIYKILPGKF